MCVWVRFMKKILQNSYNLLVIFGINPCKTFSLVKRLPGYFNDFRLLKRQYRLSKKEFFFGKPYPCLEDKMFDSGVAKGHYFHQDLLVARRIH